ncbi:phytase [Micromonospora sp. B11E3]|uniref:phytase n=1 Tax=Micromonospora sp. B11E3 TaxID=3153562 RepID=UPI00325CA0DE
MKRLITPALAVVPLLVGGRFAGAPESVERVREYGVPAVFDAGEDDRVTDYAADPGFGGRIAQDVEGLTIYRTGASSGTLVVSSQGDDTFYTYDRAAGRPTGLLVVHDGRNTPETPGEDGEARPDTNFKFLDAGFLRPAS